MSRTLAERIPTVAEWGGGLGEVLARGTQLQRRRIPFPRSHSQFLEAVAALAEDVERERGEERASDAHAQLQGRLAQARSAASEDSVVVLRQQRRVVDVEEFGGPLDQILLPSPPCRRVGRRPVEPEDDESPPSPRRAPSSAARGAWGPPSPRRPPSASASAAAARAAGTQPEPPGGAGRHAPFGGRSLGRPAPALPSPHLARLRPAREDPLAYRAISPELRPREPDSPAPDSDPLPPRPLYRAPRGPYRVPGPAGARGVADFAADSELTYEALLALDDALHRARAAVPKPPIRSTRVRYGGPGVPLPKKGEAPGECSVCLSEFKKNDPLRRLPCKHMFHENCIMPWLRTDDRCPNCRASCRAPPRGPGRPKPGASGAVAQ
eukprot:tig00021017_g17196.t1